MNEREVLGICDFKTPEGGFKGVKVARVDLREAFELDPKLRFGGIRPEVGSPKPRRGYWFVVRHLLRPRCGRIELVTWT